jgi:hypothetical protein
MKLEAAKQQYAGYPRLAVCINLAWKKVDEYYSASDISPIYFVASVLDPRPKLRYFEKNRKKEWLVGAREKLDDYMSEFKTAMGITDSEDEGDNDHMIDSQISDICYLSFGSWRSMQGDDDDSEDDMKRTEWDWYLGSKPVSDRPNFSVREWWHLRREQFPLLSRMAMETLAIPAMSTAAESAFSG